LQIAGAINNGAVTIAGVDDFTGQMRIGSALEAMAKMMKWKMEEETGQ
jgi:hypothetical protein